MGLRGPQPTPTATLKARGSRVVRDREGELTYPPGKPTCPMWLGKEAKAEWRRVTKELESVGILANVDRSQLAAYCQAWGEFVELTREIEEEGYYSTGALNQTIRHPRTCLRNEACERMVKIAMQFGLSPSTRARLKAPPQPKDKTDSGAKLYNIRG